MELPRGYCTAQTCIVFGTGISLELQYLLYGFFSRVNPPVHSQVVGTLEGTCTKFTNIIPLIWKTWQSVMHLLGYKSEHCAVNTCLVTYSFTCVVLGMTQKLLLQPKQTAARRVFARVLLFQLMLVLYMVLKEFRGKTTLEKQNRLKKNHLTSTALTPLV